MESRCAEVVKVLKVIEVNMVGLINDNNLYIIRYMGTSKTASNMGRSVFGPLLYTGLGVILVLAVIGARSLVLNQSLTANEKESIEAVTITPAPLETITPIATPTDKPLAKPAANPYFAQRINEIDTRIKELEAQKAKAKESRDAAISNLSSGDQPEGYNSMNTLLLIKQIDNKYKEKFDAIQAEITELNAEKTQIMLKL